MTFINVAYVTVNTTVTSWLLDKVAV